MKRALSLVLALTLCLALCACGKSDSTTASDGELTMAQVIEKSLATIGSIKSLSCTAKVDMNFSIEGQSVTNSTTMDMDLDLENGLYFMDMDIDATGEKQKMTIYMQLKGDKVDYYMLSDDRWMKMLDVDPTVLGGASISTDATEDFKLYYDMISASEDSSFELKDIDGKKCYALSAPVTLSSLEEAKKFKVDSILSSFMADSEDAELVSQLLAAMGPLNVVVYVDAETFMPYGFSFDFADAIAPIFELIGQKVTVNDAKASAIYVEYNQVTVTIPEDAKNGIDVSAFQQA